MSEVDACIVTITMIVGSLMYIITYGIQLEHIIQKIINNIDVLDNLAHYIKYEFKYDAYLKLLNNFSEEEANKNKEFILTHISTVRKIYTKSISKLGVLTVLFAVSICITCAVFVANIYVGNNLLNKSVIISTLLTCIIGGNIYYQFRKAMRDGRYEIILRIAKTDFNFDKEKHNYGYNYEARNL